MRNKKMILVIIGVVIALGGLYFGVSWLIYQMQAGLIPGHVPPPH